MAARATDVLGKVLLVTGKEEFLNHRAVAEAREAVRAYDAEADFSEVEAAELTAGTLGELSAPSLFTAVRFAVVRNLEHLPEESVAGLLDYAAAPADEVAIVLMHGGGQKGSGVLTKLRKLPGVVEIKAAAPKPSEFPAFVVAEVRSRGAQIETGAAKALVEAVGLDLRALSAAAHQLTDDFPGQRLTEDLVGRYFGGRAEAKSFAVADLALSGRRDQALEELRWALDNGTAAVLVTSAFAGGVRGLARFRGAVRGMRDADLAQEIGVPPWKVRTIRAQAQGWTDAGLAQAIRAVARADAEVKGAASDPSYSLERLVLTVTDLRAG